MRSAGPAILFVVPKRLIYHPTAATQSDSLHRPEGYRVKPAIAWKPLVAIVPGLAYPMLAHLATLTSSSSLVLASVIVLSCAAFLPAALSGKPIGLVGVTLAAIAILGLRLLEATALVLFLPPILINAYLAWLFGHTLAPNNMPLIERLVRLLHDPTENLDSSIVRYAARLTAVWTGLFVTLAAANLLLATLTVPGGFLAIAGLATPISVSREVWSLFANVLNYLIVAAFFYAEYAYRRRRFPQQPYRNFVDFMRRAGAAAPALLSSLAAKSLRPGATP